MMWFFFILDSTGTWSTVLGRCDALNHGIPKQGCIDFGYNDKRVGGGRCGYGCRYRVSGWIHKWPLGFGYRIVIARYHNIPHHDLNAPIDNIYIDWFLNLQYTPLNIYTLEDLKPHNFWVLFSKNTIGICHIKPKIINFLLSFFYKITLI